MEGTEGACGLVARGQGRVGWEEPFGNKERNVAFPGQMDLPHSVQAWRTELQVINAEAGQGERHPLRAAKSPAIRASGTLGSLGRGSAAGNSSLEGRGSTLLYGRVVNQLHFLFPLLNIIMLALPGFYECLPYAIMYLPEINSLLSLQTSSQCHHLSCMWINQLCPLHPEQENWFLTCRISYKSSARKAEINTPISKQLSTAFKSKPVS